jgi:hypothetical protein
MTVADVIEYAKYGELAQLGVVAQLKSNDPIEVVDAEKQVLSYINLGLLELHKRFNLNTKRLVVTMVTGTSTYTITATDFNKVLEVYDYTGTKLLLNETTDSDSITTPTYNTLSVPNAATGEDITIVYNASPTTLAWSTPLSGVTVPLPPVMLEALLHYIGYRAHGAINGNVDGENNTHYMRFEASCKKMTDIGIGISIDTPLENGTLLEEKGWR